VCARNLASEYIRCEQALPAIESVWMAANLSPGVRFVRVAADEDGFEERA
jgi:hypothetical protein